jgi:hypothetical protein
MEMDVHLLALLKRATSVTGVTQWHLINVMKFVVMDSIMVFGGVMMAILNQVMDVLQFAM